MAPYGLQTNEYLVDTPTLPQSFDGLKIVHFSDLHYLRLMNANRLKGIVEEINVIKPDIVFFTGDLIDKDAFLNEKNISTLTQQLDGIKAKYGKYAVIGNHDYNNFLDEVKEIYSNSDFQLLDNSADIVYSNSNEKLFVGGIANVSYDEADIGKTMASIPNDDISYKIILVHEPDYADTIVDEYPDVNLILSGHSHNGQVRLPIIGALYKPAYARNYYKPYYRINDTDLYVSGGLGVSSVNFRLFNSPSINFYRLNINKAPTK